MSYVMRAKSVPGYYITWISSAVDFSGTYAPETIQAGTAVVIMINGYVVGPTSATDNAVARYNLATGKLIQDSVATLSDAGILNLSASGRLEVGSNPSTSGYIRLPSAGSIYFRNVENTANLILIQANSNDTVRYGNDGYITYLYGERIVFNPGAPAVQHYVFDDLFAGIYKQKDIRLYNAADTNYTTFKGSNVSSNISFILPDTQGLDGQVLNTNGSGACGWTTLPDANVGWGATLGTSNTSDGYTVNLTGNSIFSSINQNITIDPQDGYGVNIGNAGDTLLSTSGTAVNIHNNLVILSDGYSITATAGENLNITLPESNTKPGSINLTAASTLQFGGGVNAGNVNITAGVAHNGFTGGEINIIGGDGVNGGGTGGPVYITGGPGQVGGDITLRMGGVAESSTDGKINFQYRDGTTIAYFQGNSLVGNSTLHLTGESDSASPGSPGGVVVQGGSSTVLGNGGTITILGGSAEGDGYLGGTASITGGSTTLGTGGSAYVAGGNGAIGGNVILRPGDGSSTDGRIEIQHVDSTVSMYIDTWSKVLFGVNEINIYGGNQTALIASGDATIRGGNSSIGNAGHTYIYGGAASGDGFTGGNIAIRSGSSTTNGTGGTLSISGGGADTGGPISITGGTSSVAVGASVSITGGTGIANDGGDLVFAAGEGLDGYGGDISITAGDGSAGHTGGQVVISGGGATWGSPGIITITGNDSEAPHRIGGSITLQCGSGSDYGGSLSISTGSGPVNGNIDITAGDGNITIGADNITSTTGAFVLNQDDGSGTDFGGHSSIICSNAYAKENLTPFVMSVPGSLTVPINTREYMWSAEVTDGTAQEFDIDISNLDAPHDGYRTYVAIYDILATNPLGYAGSGCVYQRYYATFVKDSNNTLHTFGTNYLDVEINSLVTHWTLATSAADAATIRLILDPASRNYRFMIRCRLLMTGTYGG